MAVSLTSCARNRAFFALPPNLRASAYRHFTTTSSRNSNLVDIAVAGPTAFIDTIHSLGVPWPATLPLSALLVRSLVFYLISLPAHHARQTQATLSPLISAHVLKDIAIQRGKKMRRDMSGPSGRLAEMMNRYRLIRSNSRKLTSVFAEGRYTGRFGGLINFGVLIAMTEAVRVKCGSSTGLLRALLWPFEWLKNQITGTEVTAEAVPNTLSPSFDPSLTTDGFAWCADLTLPDPTLALPLSLSLAVAAGSLLRPLKTSRSNPTKKKFSLESKLGMGVSTLMFFGTQNMPAAVLLYAVPSFLSGFVFTRWLNWRRPIRPGIEPCRRRGVKLDAAR